MKHSDLIVHAVASIAFGITLAVNPAFADTMLFFGDIMAILTASLGVLTLCCLVLKVEQAVRVLKYVYAGMLGALTAMGIARMLQGQPNVMWIFTLSLLANILLSVKRGDVIE